GVELQYEYPDWSIERYNERMGEIRRYFDAKYGTGKLVSRTRDTDSDVIQTLVGYQWTIGATMLELFYFSAQHDRLVFRTISVVSSSIASPFRFCPRTVIDLARSISPVITGKLKHPSVPISVSPPRSICGLINTSGIAAAGSISLPFSFIVVGRSSTCETSSTVS